MSFKSIDRKYALITTLLSVFTVFLCMNSNASEIENDLGRGSLRDTQSSAVLDLGKNEFLNFSLEKSLFPVREQAINVDDYLNACIRDSEFLFTDDPTIRVDDYLNTNIGDPFYPIAEGQVINVDDYLNAFIRDSVFPLEQADSISPALSGTRLFACFIAECTVKFSSKCCLACHERTHAESKLFAFSSKDYDERPDRNAKLFVCCFKNCSAIFKRKADLSYHQRDHMEEKPFACSFNECVAAFYRRCDLTCHERIHSGKHLECSFNCGATFKLRTGLIRHERAHLNSKAYSAVLCGPQFVVTKSN
jgi:hypothetical protein